jgi:spore coat polysaccharide biosynthesis protein SpsF (cytidylyltransferase family)
MSLPHESSNVIGIIQARMSSSRLPGKILLPITGMPMLRILAERVRRSRISEWWLATSAGRDDDLTAEWGEALGLRVYRGSLEDVLSRFAAIIRLREPEWIVRVTADDPLMDGPIIDLMLDRSLATSGVEVVGPCEKENPFPLGYLPQVARADAVLRSEAEIPADQEYHRVHVLSWLSRGAHRLAFSLPPDWPARPGWRWTVDTYDDYQMMRAAFELLAERWSTASYLDLVDLFDAHPEVAAMNENLAQKDLEDG